MKTFKIPRMPGDSYHTAARAPQSQAWIWDASGLVKKTLQYPPRRVDRLVVPELLGRGGIAKEMMDGLKKRNYSARDIVQGALPTEYGDRLAGLVGTTVINFFARSKSPGNNARADRKNTKPGPPPPIQARTTHPIPMNIRRAHNGTGSRKFNPGRLKREEGQLETLQKTLHLGQKC